MAAATFTFKENGMSMTKWIAVVACAASLAACGTMGGQSSESDSSGMSDSQSSTYPSSSSDMSSGATSSSGMSSGDASTGAQQQPGMTSPVYPATPQADGTAPQQAPTQSQPDAGTYQQPGAVGQ